MTLSKLEFQILTYILYFWAFFQAIGTSPTIIASLALMVFMIFIYFRYWDKINLKSLGIEFYLILSLCITLHISLFYNWPEHNEPTRGLSKIRYFFIFLLSYPILKSLHLSTSDWKNILKKIILFLSGSYFIASIAGIISRFTCFQVNHWKYECNLRNPGLTGIMQYSYETPLVLIIVLFAAYLSKELLFTKKEKFFLKAASLFMITGLITSNGRGAIIGVLIGISSIFFFFRKTIIQKITIANVFKLSILTLLLTYFTFGNKFIPYGENRIVSSSANESNDIRKNLNILSWEAFKQRPWFGFGLLHPKNEITNAHSIALKYTLIDTHNTHTQVLVDGGIFSFIIYLLLFSYIFVTLFKNNDEFSKVLLGIWITFFIIASVHSMLITGTGTAVLLFMLLIATSLTKEYSNRLLRNK
ncbi:MAG: O-antigen ligase family protein [Bacteriovoracaceae bacterium]|nr:O-antigen ligase family protein [Bacteriovoracaceae bacterium]